MVFHNSPDGYRGVEPMDEHVFSNPYVRAPINERDGLFYRGDLSLSSEELAARLTGGNTADIQDYQYWTESAWKTEHATYASVKRFGNKLYEEYRELVEAIELFDRKEGQDKEADEVLAELGDVLWCATVLACCASADIDSGLKNLLYQYVMGIQHIEKGVAVEPGWRDTAGKLATKYGQLSIHDIDQLIAVGFEPHFSTVMNIFDPKADEDDVHDHARMMLGTFSAIRNTAEEMYGYGGEINSEGFETFVLSCKFKQNARVVGKLVGRTYLQVAFLADRVIDKKLGDVITKNVTKLSARVASNTVDKADGIRSG